MIKIKKCKICSSEKLLVLKRYKVNCNLSDDWKHVLEKILNKQNLNINLCMCRKCGFIFYKDVFDAGEIEKLYKKEDRFQKSRERARKNGRSEEFKRTFSFFKRKLPFSKIKKILDVGAGDFVIFDELMRKHPNAEYCAMDPSYPEDFYKNARVFHDLIENFNVRKSYDLVLLVHVLEHVYDLNLFLRKTNLLVNDGMYLYVEVPFQVGPGLFLNRSVNSQHINYFTPITILNILNKHDFSVEEIEFDKEGYRYNGMPGMIRLLARKKKSNTTKNYKNGLLKNIFFLINPSLYIKNILFLK